VWIINSVAKRRHNLLRYYVTLAANHNYRRRITLLADPPSAAVVVEYFGKHVTSAPYGGSKNPTAKAPYIRKPATTFTQVGEVTQKMSVQAGYNHLLQQMDIDEAPRDSEVVRNKKRRDAKDRHVEGGMQHCANFADEMLAVINMMHTDTFVRAVQATRKHVPSVILYDKHQLNDIKEFCFGGKEGSVLAFDKTYNLGAIYVTPSIYKNLARCRRRTNDSPMFLGPIFMHGHSDFDTYAYFFGHLSACLVACKQQQLPMGSDDEAAMRKAMQHTFPQALFVVCCRHLK